MEKSKGPGKNKDGSAPAQRTLKEMLKRLQELPKPTSIEERDVEPLPERPRQ